MHNKGGQVIFTHQRHVGYVGDDCTKCHHEKHPRFGAGVMGDSALPCGACHVTEFNAQFSADHQKNLPPDTCVQCHHAELGPLTWSHDDHADQYASACTDCHHGTDIEAEPGSCRDCHEATADGAKLALRDAVHQRCANCHAEMYDKKLAGCSDCHTLLPGKIEGPQPACSACHFESEALPLPGRMDSFHSQCMSCHEEMGAGPFGDGSCRSCHTR